MAVAFDALGVETTGTGNLSWTHTPVGTPRAAIVAVITNVGGGEVTGVTYGGVTMTEVSGSPNVHSTGEPGTVQMFFLGASIPTGAQTVSVTVNGTGSAKVAYSATLTAAADTEIVDVDATINSDSVAGPGVTLSLGGRTSFGCIAFHAGGDSTGAILPNSGWTGGATPQRHDFGSQVAGFFYRTAVTSTDFSAGWNQGVAEDACAIALAVSEVASGITGSMSATEGSGDTLTGAGDVYVQGSLAATESGSDTLAATGDVLVQGSLTATESGADTCVATGKVYITGSMAAVETGQDGADAAGDVHIVGSMAATESGQDSFAGAGSVEGAEPVVSVSGSGKVRRRNIFTESVNGPIATGRNPRRRVEQLLLARVI